MVLLLLCPHIALWGLLYVTNATREGSTLIPPTTVTLQVRIWTCEFVRDINIQTTVIARLILSDGDAKM